MTARISSLPERRSPVLVSLANCRPGSGWLPSASRSGAVIGAWLSRVSTLERPVAKSTLFALTCDDNIVVAGVNELITLKTPEPLYGMAHSP